jgi:HSP20 family protein
MKLQKLNPWNWLQHEETTPGKTETSLANRDYSYRGQDNPMMQFHREVDRLFEDVFRGFGFPSLSRQWDSNVTGQNQLAAYNPELNVASDENSYHVTLEAPGLSVDDVSLELDGRRLIIRGNKQEEKESKDKQYYRVERRFGQFQRVLALPEDANDSDIIANMDKGVLEIRIPRQPGSSRGVQKIAIGKAS